MNPSRGSAWFVLEDGTIFQGRSVGAEGEAFGEAVFNTAMTGYQEILTDPSYKGQIVCMTYPHIGNYGVNDEDVESRRMWAEGLVVRKLSPMSSNHRAQESLEAYLKRHGVVAIDGVDTRQVTLKLRQQGSMKAGISTTEQDLEHFAERVRHSACIVGVDLVKEVTCSQSYEWPVTSGGLTSMRNSECGIRNAELKEIPAEFPIPNSELRTPNLEMRPKHEVVVLDYGVKLNILRQLAALGCHVTVMPASTTAKEVLSLRPHGVVLSNGPGDPAAVPYAVETIRGLMGHVPILGICLGHQLLGLAYKGETFKLKFGHHGANHPVQDTATGKIEITSQNHNFAVRLETIPDRQVKLTHKNLNDGTLEGMQHRSLPIFSVQYHPEASPGPHDARYLFRRFIDIMGHGT